MAMDPKDLRLPTGERVPRERFNGGADWHRARALRSRSFKHKALAAALGLMYRPVKT